MVAHIVHQTTNDFLKCGDTEIAVHIEKIIVSYAFVYGKMNRISGVAGSERSEVQKFRKRG